MGCVIDAHEEKVDKIFKGNKVTIRRQKALSFEGIEDLFPEFIKLNDIPVRQNLEERRL